MKKVLFLLLVMMFPLVLNASSFNPKLECPKGAVPGETITCTLSATIDNITAIQGTYSLGQTTYDSFTFDSKIKNSSLQTSASSTAFTIQENENAGSISTVLGTKNITIGTLKVKLPNIAGPYYLSIEFRGTDAETFGTVGKQTQTATINQNSQDSTLKSLSVEGMILGPKFAPNITSYSLPETDEESITIKAEANDSTSKVTGTGTVPLEYGSNTKVVTVTSAAGTQTKYTIKVTRTDMRESINILKSLSVKGYTITPAFASTTKTYSLNVENNVSKVTIEAAVESSKSSFVKNYGPRTVTLNYGKNDVKIKVKAENGSENTYTINITRKDNRDDNNYLSTISLSKGNITFSKTTMTYTVNVDGNVKDITISAEAESQKAKVSGTGTKELKEGTNKFTITVKAENETERKYTVIVNRGKATVETNETADTNETNETIENVVYVKSLDIKNANIVFDPDVHEYTVKLKQGETKLDILYQIEDGYTSTLEGNDNLKDGSIVKLIIDDNGLRIEYNFNIKIVSGAEEEETSSNDIILYVAVGLLALVVIGIVLSALTKEKPTPEQVVKQKYFQDDNQKFYTSKTLIEGVKSSQVSGSMISQVERSNSMTERASEIPPKPEVQNIPEQVETLDFDPVTQDDINNQNNL